MANPAGRYTQREVFDALGYRPLYWGIFEAAGIDSRPLCLPPEDTVKLTPQGQHEHYHRSALLLGEKAISDCLKKANLEPRDIDHLVWVSCTGLSVPAPSYYLAGIMGFKRATAQTPVVGTGCQGALPGLRVASDSVRANPGTRALVICCEITNAAYFPGNKPDLGQAIASGIFGDGAACALISDSGPGLEFLDFYTVVDPSLIDDVKIAWRDARLKIELSSRVSEIVREPLRETAAELLRRHGLEPGRVKHWLIHAGGSSILDSAQQVLNLEESHLRFSRATWREYGNLSSATVLVSLEKLLASGELRHGDWGLIIGLGAGFEASGILWRYQGQPV